MILDAEEKLAGGDVDFGFPDMEESETLASVSERAESERARTTLANDAASNFDCVSAATAAFLTASIINLNNNVTRTEAALALKSPFFAKDSGDEDVESQLRSSRPAFAKEESSYSEPELPSMGSSDDGETDDAMSYFQSLAD